MRGRRSSTGFGRALGALAASALLLGPATAGAAQGAPRAPAAAPLYGVTIDEIGHLDEIVGSLSALPARPTTRVYFDSHEPASYYAPALAQIHRVSGVMGELLDSSDERSTSTAAFQERVRSYVSALAPDVDIWEIGNEVNGNWTGPYATVSAKLTEAYEDVTAAGGKTALTLYANNFAKNNCGDGPAELTPVQFAQQYVPAPVANGLDYVLLSYYPTQCKRTEPTSATLAAYLVQLHAQFPNAALGFGEVGLPHHATRGSAAKAEQIMSWAYSLNPGLPYYVGGYFWWYGAQDALRAASPLSDALQEAFDAERTALG
jgi:hypothetical protein